MERMTVRWLGHSCFQVEAEGFVVVFDPFADGSVPGLSPVRTQADLVLCSHQHQDHAGTAGITLRKGGISPFTVTALDSYHDEVRGAKRGPNRIHILEGCGVKLVHMGDVGCMPTAKQKEALKGADVILMPVGGYYTLEPKLAHQLAEELSPKLLVPMHYRSESFGYDVIAPLETYLALCRDVAYAEGDVLSLPEDLEGTPKTLVLRYQG